MIENKLVIITCKCANYYNNRKLSPGQSSDYGLNYHLILTRNKNEYWLYNILITLEVISLFEKHYKTMTQNKQIIITYKCTNYNNNRKLSPGQGPIIWLWIKLSFDNKTLTSTHININRLLIKDESHINQLRESLRGLPVHVLTVSETWRTPNETERDIDIPGFTVKEKRQKWWTGWRLSDICKGWHQCCEKERP